MKILKLSFNFHTNESNEAIANLHKMGVFGKNDKEDRMAIGFMI